VPRDCCTKRANSRMRTGLHRPLYSTALPYSERRKQELCATALAGAAAPRTRKTKYGNTMPFQAAYSGEPAAPMRRKGKRAAGECSAVRCKACVKEQTRAHGSKSQVRQTRCASRERGDAGRQERASHAGQV
jgi:hypothetical protein